MASDKTSDAALLAAPLVDAPMRPPSLRDRQKELTRQALLDGARSAFAERGYADVTIDDIATRAGASRATFYLYFTKGQVLAELLQGAFSLHRGDHEFQGQALSDLDFSTPESVRAWIAAFVHVWRDNRLLGRAWMEGDVQDPEIQAKTDRRIRKTVDVMTDQILAARKVAGKPLTREQARARAATMDVQLQSFCYHVLVRGLDVDLEAGIEAMVEQWQAAVFGFTPA